jgi:hypothetical protein
VPDRFAQVGWKYQPQGHQSSFLNHPNKVNFSGRFNQTTSFKSSKGASQDSKQQTTTSDGKSQDNHFVTNYRADFANLTAELKALVNTNSLL